jgi:alpha-glucosidase
MQRELSLRIGPIMSALVLLGAMSGLRAAELRSPNGKLALSFQVEDIDDAKACPVYALAYDGKTIVEKSRLGLDLKGGPLDAGLKLLQQAEGQHDTTWKPVYGERNTIRDHYNEMVAEVREEAAPQRVLQLTFRAYDEGVAFRYTVPKQPGIERVEIVHEKTEFRFPKDHTTWATYSAQGSYSKVTISQVKNGCERPLPVMAADDLYLALGEARLVDYARMKFAPLKGHPHGLCSELSGPVVSVLPMTTPWRFIMAAPSPGQLLEHNDLLLNLNDPCALADTSWIKPGKVIREVTLTTVGAEACIDFAVRHKLQYILFDAGWYGHEYSKESDASAVNLDPKRSKGPLDLHAVIAYGNERGVGIILYVNHLALEKQLDQILPLYKQWGVKGVKYGFVNVGSQQWTSWLHEAIRKAAEQRLMVDIHDEYRPTGYTRTYPNLMTVEGVRGDEEKLRTNDQSMVAQFARFLAGPADNTVCYYDERVDRLATHAYQLAKPVCFYSPLQHLYWYDRPQSSAHEPELEFWDEMPTVWDDTKVIHGRIGEYAVIARRSAENWFIGCMNSGEARTLDVPLDFLDKGRKYTASIYSDDPAVPTRTHVKLEKITVDSVTVLKAAMTEKGGRAIRIIPAP